MAQTTLGIGLPEDTILQLHRYLWTPARYAHPRWLMSLGFKPKLEWSYGENSQLDRCLNQALRVRRGTPRLPLKLNDRQWRIAQLAPHMEQFALAMGLLMLGCNDYFLLPDYRKAMLRWLSEAVIRQLFGLCRGTRRAVFSPLSLKRMALDLGTAVLHRAAQAEPVLYAMLILSPPCERALWPSVPTLAMNLLERSLCAEYR